MLYIISIHFFFQSGVCQMASAQTFSESKNKTEHKLRLLSSMYYVRYGYKEIILKEEGTQQYNTLV